ncbi:Fungal specific transcription factor domain [Ceratobasidium sp. AG-Ba]|nr:Fungal specific transcription factor domain [Ceratobasidium sp. AG-Ba]
MTSKRRESAKLRQATHTPPGQPQGTSLSSLRTTRWPNRAPEKPTLPAIPAGSASARQVVTRCTVNPLAISDPSVTAEPPPAQKNYVAALEARVALLEGILKRAGASDTTDALDLLPEDDEPAQPDALSTSRAPPLATEPSAPSQPMNHGPRESELGFIPADDAANALESINLANPDEETNDPSSELDLGMGDWVPLISLDAEHKLLAYFWDWQRMHLPFVAPVPFLSAYAIHSEAAHPNEPIPPPPPPPPPNPFSGPSAIGVPRAASEPVADLAQFISPVLLDASFAISCLFTGDPETSERFYKRAESRIITEAANPRLATVQAILVMATWELGHARAPAAWTLLGVGCALCVPCMNVDATPLVRRGVISKRLFETRNFVFWATYNLDRFSAMCMGMHPLMDKRMISTPRHSSLASANVIESEKPPEPKSNPTGGGDDKPTASDTNVTWWSPATLGLSDVIIQAGWEAIRDMIRMSDMLYSFDAPKRTPQEDLELVTRNNLTIQRFLDELPTWLRSTGAIRRKDNGLVYLHMFTHLTSIVASRPFLSPRPLSEEAMRIDATLDPVQPSHSSHIIRRYRTLAFRVARASALQITSLIRHIPLSSPCVTVPYAVYSACTILLLAPDDAAAMDGVRTGIACLECMDKTGYWVNSAKDARDRIHALAARWGVKIMPKRQVPENDGSGVASGSGGSGSGAGGSGSGPQPPGDDQEGARGHGTNSSSITPAESGNNTSLARDQSGSYQDGADTSGLNPSAHASTSTSSQSQVYIGDSHRTHPTGSLGFGHYDKATLNEITTGPPSYDDAVAHQADTRQVEPQVYMHKSMLMVRISTPNTHYGAQNSQQLASDQPSVQNQQPVQHVHYHFHNYMYPPPGQYMHNIPYNAHYQPNQLPHVAYGTTHADPQHDLHLTHNHWHQVLPPADPNLPFPPDPTACTDIAACLRIQYERPETQQAQDNFAPIMSQMYTEVAIPSAFRNSASAMNSGSFAPYPQSSQTGVYGDPSANYGGYGYGASGV